MVEDTENKAFRVGYLIYRYLAFITVLLNSKNEQKRKVLENNATIEFTSNIFH